MALKRYRRKKLRGEDMVLKYFCDCCGKEVNRNENILSNTQKLISEDVYYLITVTDNRINASKDCTLCLDCFKKLINEIQRWGE